MAQPVRRRFILALAIHAWTLTLVTGCGKDSPSGPDGGPANPSFAADIKPIFDSPTCATSSCHAPPTNQNGLNLLGVTRARLVSVPATSLGDTLVIAGNAEDSYIVRKLEGRNLAGVRMPRNAAALSSATIQTIRDWIDQGALDN